MPSKIVSFGFKHVPGPLLTPQDLTIDVRPRVKVNPWSEPGLRALTGRDPEVGVWIRAHTPGYLAVVRSLIDDTRHWPGPVYLGCTGGRHRSVYFAQLLGAYYGIPVEHLHIGIREDSTP